MTGGRKDEGTKFESYTICLRKVDYNVCVACCVLGSSQHD